MEVKKNYIPAVVTVSAVAVGAGFIAHVAHELFSYSNGHVSNEVVFEKKCLRLASYL